MLIEVIVNPRAKRRHLVLKEIDDMLNRGADHRVARLRGEPIALLRPHAVEGVEPTT